MKRSILVSAIIGLVITAFYLVFFKRTAYSVGSDQVGFRLPKSLQVDEFTDQWNNNPSGDGMVAIVFSIMKDEKYLQNECRRSGFKRLPITDSLPDSYIYKFITKTDSMGYYKLRIDEHDERDYSISVLDLKRHRLYVYYVLM